MNFNRIFNSINPQSAKNDTDVLKTKNYDDNRDKNRRIYQISNTDGKSLSRSCGPINANDSKIATHQGNQ